MEKPEIKFKRGDIVYKETFFGGVKIKVVNGQTDKHLLLGHYLWDESQHLVNWCELSPKKGWKKFTI